MHTDDQTISLLPARPIRVGQRPTDGQRLPIKQRDLTRAMKAAKAAGINSFELVDGATGLIFRATLDGDLPREMNDLDAELTRFKARRGG